MNALERAWYKKRWWLWLLWPLTLLFTVFSATRRYLYKAGFKHSEKPADTMVIVVGNISVGGNGKTPVVIELAEYLRSKGLRPGILSRGYGGEAKQFPHTVSTQDSARFVGDEPRLMAARTHLPVVIDPVRTRGAQRLKSEHKCNVIICDDGLQHYALKRDMELVVMDERRFGNGHLLPMGPLREGVWRLDSVDMILHNVNAFEPARLLGVATAQYPMQLHPQYVVNVQNAEQSYTVQEFIDQEHTLHALAGIGNPARFFGQIKSLGIQLSGQTALSDHYQFDRQDLPDGPVIMTEKDAVKVASFAHSECWYLKVSARLPAKFYQQLNAKLVSYGLHAKR
ncbi:tetraacyldisaccharide 4'-kinase [Alteromonas lipotrueiana]|uniref:tetraacyldisaccharide 4'-kinase n=1 Tax=Alteromonas lipotrueiana TaxID=2803815 RepID=UPI001C4598E1|nr:tetraacyldisaccharide 4'-kinase [Alteromonas lipotrueiana]